IFFLYPLESERTMFITAMKRKIAYEYIEQDKGLNLSDDQKKEVKKELKKAEEGLKESIRRLYRAMAIPDKEGLKDGDLGIPTYGEEKRLDQEVYEKLRSDGQILEKIAPLVLKEKYLSEKEYVLTEQLYQSSLKTPGERRPINKAVLEEGITEGVRTWLFGLGELEGDKPACRYFKEKPSIAFSGNEVMIGAALCQEQRKKEEEPVSEPPLYPQSEPKAPFKVSEQEIGRPVKKRVELRFQVPKGKVANIMGVMNLLQSKFETLEIKLMAKDGEISEQDYEDKIEEAFRQSGIELDKI
ncbi:AAA family ATPase, partial [bacterium]|nr:AAA family ATPase [bacterium]